MKRYVLWSVGLVLFGMVLIIGFALGVLSTSSPATQVETHAKRTIDERPTLQIGTVPVSVELAVTPEEIARGLSGRTSLPEGTGMLFIMQYPSRYGFWMPDMHFSIDIIWFDEHFSVIDITGSVSPESYPEQFRPSDPALYVLEVPAGFAERHRIRVGDQAILTR